MSTDLASGSANGAAAEAIALPAETKSRTAGRARPMRALFVCHEGSLTGAPMNLLHLVTWLRANTDVELTVLMVQDGPITHRFQQVCDVVVLDRSSLRRNLGLLHRGVRRLGSSRVAPALERFHLRPQVRRLTGFDVIYLNSAASISVLAHVDPAALVVAHVHELEVALSTMWPRDLANLRTGPDRFIAASGAVKAALEDVVGIEPDKIAVHYEFIDTGAFTQDSPSLREVERIRKAQLIPPDAAIVMGVGTVDWRKGPDLFVQLAAEVRRRTRESIHFVWVGGDLTGLDMVRLHSDMRRAGTDHVHFVGTHPDPRPWFAAADVLALTSREDPFPLVCLEHAAMGHPIVTFRNGGMVELLSTAGPSAGFGVVDYLDVGAMAERVLAFLGDETLRRAAAEELMTATIEHHDVGVCAPALWADVTSWASH